MSLLEKYLSKADVKAQRKTELVDIDGDQWEVRELTFEEDRKCYKLSEDANGNFDGFRYNDVRIVKSTEHFFPWNNLDLLQKYKAKDKFELPVKLFNHNKEGYRKLLEAVKQLNTTKPDDDVVDELKN